MKLIPYTEASSSTWLDCTIHCKRENNHSHISLNVYYTLQVPADMRIHPPFLMWSTQRSLVCQQMASTTRAGTPGTTAVDCATVTGDRRCAHSYPAPAPPVVPLCSGSETAAHRVLVRSLYGSCGDHNHNHNTCIDWYLGNNYLLVCDLRLLMLI
jgi:hypothetical protein